MRKYLAIVVSHSFFDCYMGQWYYIGANRVLIKFTNDISSENSLKQEELYLDLVRAIHAFHAKGVLHNDLHHGDILVKYNRYVKIIDLGKSTMIDDPILYFINPGIDKHKRYEK